MKIETIKNKQLEELQLHCKKNGIVFQSIEKLLQAEKMKKLRKRNHYIQQTIDSEIKKAIENENK